MRSVSIGGAGLIVGTALSVIIPEGVHALYDSGLFIVDTLLLIALKLNLISKVKHH